MATHTYALHEWTKAGMISNEKFVIKALLVPHKTAEQQLATKGRPVMLMAKGREQLHESLGVDDPKSETMRQPGNDGIIQLVEHAVEFEGKSLSSSRDGLKTLHVGEPKNIHERKSFMTVTASQLGQERVAVFVVS